MSSSRPLISVACAVALLLGATPGSSQTFQILEIQPQSPAGKDGTGPFPDGVIGPVNPRHASPLAPTGQGFVNEVEPNGTSATATPLGGTNVVMLGTVFPANDVDFYSFTGAAGDRVFAAVQTSFDASASGDSVLDLLDTDGATVLENDLNDGAFNASSSSIAGRALPSAGTFFLRVRHNTATGTIRPYQLHVRVQSGSPVAEVEANNTPATATPLPASGWVSGSVDPVADVDFFSMTLAAGDSVFLSLDIDPERDNVQWNGRLGFALFGNPPANQILVVNDTSTGSVANPLSEAFFFTVKEAGTYFAYVDTPVAGAGGPTFTYSLSVSVHPFVNGTANCTTYTSTDVPVAIPAGAPPITVTSTLTVPGNPRIADLDVSINMNHTFMQDLDVHLSSPAGNDNGLFTDIGAATVGGAQTLMDLRFDDEAALPPSFALSASWISQPELAYRLDWFDGEDAGGTWTLTIRDDASGDGGSLNAWSLTICEPPPPPTCAAGFIQETVFTNDFEAGDGGFTHSGVQDEWERGLPSFVPITTCNSGTNCWKTDLDNTYNASASQDLLSPAIDLTNHVGPVLVTWAQRYHIESATFDHMFVDFRRADDSNPVRLYEWLGATMNNTVGSTPSVTIAESSGWSTITRQVDSLAGFSSELLFHLDSDTTVQLAGLAVDDVSVTACRAASSDLSITKDDGVVSAIPGGTVTYVIVATNNGIDAANPVSVVDTFPAACTSVSYTSVAAGGATGNTAGPAAGNINDVALNMPSGSSVTYTATCTIASSATGSLVNTATISSSNPDPNTNNNTATDTDTLTPQANLSVTKTDGLTTAVAGQATSYTIVVSNPGPSDAPGTTVADTFPAAYTGVTWTCVGAGGGTCSGAGAGNINDVANLPAGSSVTYTVNGTIDAGFSGTLSNTATATTAGGVTELDPSDNTATDDTTVGTPPSLSATKTVSGTFEEGGAIVYTVVITNNGGTAQGDNPGDEFVDILPAELTLVGASATSGIASTAGNTVTWNGSIPAGGSVTITIDATINAGTAGLVVTNQGTVNADTDGDGTNDTPVPTDDPVPPAGDDPTEFVVGATASILEIPTLSTVGFATLAVVLAALSLLLIRRRRAV